MSVMQSVRHIPVRVPFGPNAQVVARLLMVVGLVAVGLFIYSLQVLGMVFPLLAAAGLCLAILVVVRPEIGLAAVVVCAGFIRLSIGTGTSSVIVASLGAALLLVLGWIAHRLLHRQRLILVPWSIAIPAMALVGFTVFSLIWGRATLDPRVVVPGNFYRVQFGQSLLIIVAIGVLFVGADLFRSRYVREALVWAMIAIGVAALPFRWFVIDQNIVNTAGLFGLWFVAITWSMALVNHRLPQALRIVLASLSIMWLLMAFTREGSWVSGWLPPVIALLAITIVARPKLGFASLLIAVMAGMVYYASLYSLLITEQQEQGSLGGDFGRLQLIQRNLDVISDELLLGTGPAGYALYYMTFVPERSMSTHNNYVDILAQTGVFGLLSLVALIAALFLVGRQTMNRCRHEPADFALAAAIVGAIPALAAGLWLGDWLIPFVYNQTIAGFDHSVYSWLMLAALCGLYVQYRDHGTSTDA